MSWDVLLHAAYEPPPPAGELPDDWRGEPLGSQAEVRAKISECLAEVDWSDPAWGTFDGDEYTYEFNTGDDEPCSSVMVHVRGGGPAVAPLLQLARRCHWYLLDTSSGEWMHHSESPEAGWLDFQAFRDQALQQVYGSRTAAAKKPWWRFW